MAELALPMSPAAWELVSLWSEVWDAPRFRGQERVQDATLSREAIAPLLKLAASCVVALQQGTKVHGNDAPGASRELLVAVIDGHGPAALADPRCRPADFVRGLAKSAFMTGDGEYTEGLSEAQLDQLLDQLCASQLEQAASLVRDPSAGLRSALQKLTAAVEEVLASPPEEGDLAAVAQRLLLVQRLERAAEDASAILVKDTSSTEVESSQAMEPESLDPMESTMEPESHEDHEEEAEKDNPLKRTKSQVAAKLKVQKVKEHQENMLKEVYDLSRTTSALSKREVEVDESEKLRAELRAVEEARKKARNFGEDLLEDMMALDNLSGLSDEDRSTRKATLSGLEGLLQDVDTAKSRLAMLHRQLEGKLHKAEDLAAKKRQAKEVAKLRAEKKAREEETSPTPEVDHPPVSPRQTAAASLEPAAPGKAVWEKVRLPLRFAAREERQSYVISATVPGLSLEDLKLELGDASTLLVSGLRMPSQKEAALMRKRIAQKIRQVAQTSPEKFAKLAKAIPEVTEDAYLELGQGEFGRFSETFRLPKDVDVENIEASYTDGVLRIVLPKMKGQWSYPQGIPRARRGVTSHPGLGRGAAGPWGGSLFGGHDDFFRW